MTRSTAGPIRPQHAGSVLTVVTRGVQAPLWLTVEEQTRLAIEATVWGQVWRPVWWRLRAPGLPR